MKEVVVVIGPGQIGQAIARRISFGKRVLLADKMQENAEAAAKVLGNAGYDVTVTTVDVSLPQDVHALVQDPRYPRSCPRGAAAPSGLTIPIEIRPHICATVATRSANETRLQIGQPDIIRPGIATDRD
jgi:CheY-like chemotaxis protein